MVHIHEVLDSDKCFTIDPITRAIVNDAGNKKTQLIQNDHNSERFSFKLPRYIEGHDMSLSNKVEVHYINLDQSSNERSVGVYEVTDLALSEDNESVLLSWLISNNATKYVGVLSFAICFKCMSDNVIDYSWNTAINSSIQIAKGMYNSEIIVKDYVDVLEAWKEEFMSSIGLSGGCLRAIDPIGTGSFSMNRIEGTDVGTNSVTLGTSCIADGDSCYAEGKYTIAGNYKRLDIDTTISEQIDSKNMICLSIVFDKEVFPISVGDSIIIVIAIIDITTHDMEYKNITTIVQSITEPDPLAEIKEYKIYIDENENLNSGTDFETTRAFAILYKNQNQSSGGASPMSNIGCHAEGSATTASGESSHAEGNNTTASGDRSHAEGTATTASGESSHTEGYDTTASGQYSHAEGYDTTASGDRSHAEGNYTEASGDRSHAEGWVTTASGKSSHAEGYDTTASGQYSHAEGYGTTASGQYSHAEGYSITASGDSSHAEGNSTTASGDSSHAEGSFTEASGNYSHAEGYNTKASSHYQHVQGQYNIEDTNNTYAHIVGGGTSDTDRKNIHTLDWNGNAVYSGDVSSKTISINRKEGSTIGRNSVTLGQDCTASGNYSHAEGWSTKAIGDESHAEGNSTEAKGRTSHAEGAMTTAIGEESHAEGYMTTAISNGAHAEGYKTEASGNYSHVEGYETSTLGEAQHVQGKYNIGNSSYAHIVGGGTSDTDRKNIHTLDWNGNAVYSGDVSSKTISINRKEGSTIGQNSVALGQDCTASGSFSHAEGDRTTASGNFGSHAEGCMSTASGSNSHAEGEYTTASSNASHAEGTRTTASGADSHAEGYNTKASGDSSHAEGYYSLSGGYTKFDAALGSETVDSTINYYIDVANLDATLISTNDEIYVLVKDNASTERQICKITVSSITEYNTTDEVSTVKHKIYFDKNELENQMSSFPNIEVTNIYVKNNNNPYSTHAEGYLTVASGNYGSHAEGIHTTASGDYGSHAEGEYTTASGSVSHAEGYYTMASGDSSHAEGDNTTASGENSHAEGHKSTASGYASHAEGEYTKASGKYAHTEGYHTTARINSQHVQGKYNVEDTNGIYAHIVGGGTSNTNRKNIHTLDWNGNAVYSGDVNATDSEGNQVSLLDTKWKLKGNVVNNNTISLPDNYTELKVMTYKTDQEYPIAYTQTILKDMIDVINKDTMQLYCGNTQQYGASWSINKTAKTIQLANIENATSVNNCATYLYYR